MGVSGIISESNTYVNFNEVMVVVTWKYVFVVNILMINRIKRNKNHGLNHMQRINWGFIQV